MTLVFRPQLSSMAVLQRTGQQSESQRLDLNGPTWVSGQVTNLLSASHSSGKEKRLLLGGVLRGHQGPRPCIPIN